MFQQKIGSSDTHVLCHLLFQMYQSAQLAILYAELSTHYLLLYAILKNHRPLTNDRNECKLLKLTQSLQRVPQGGVHTPARLSNVTSRHRCTSTFSSSNLSIAHCGKMNSVVPSCPSWCHQWNLQKKPSKTS